MDWLTPRALLAAAIVALVAATEVSIFTLSMPPPARDVLQLLVGVLIAKFGTVYDYYFGAAKTDGSSQ